MIPIRHFLTALIVLAVALSSLTADAQSADSFTLEGEFREGYSILAPGQPAILDVFVHPTSPNNDASIDLTIQAELWSVTENRSIASLGGTRFGGTLASIAQETSGFTAGAPLPLSFVTPDKDGVYEIRLTFNHTTRRTLLGPGFDVLGRGEARGTETRHQFVVVGSQIPPRATGDWTLTDRRNLSLVEESAADSSRRLLPNLQQLPGMSHLPSLPRVGELPRITDLPRPAELIGRIPRPFNRQGSSEIHPEEFLNYLFGEYTHLLPLHTEIGEPYLIEIDYAVNTPQTLGIAIVDHFRILQNDNASGNVAFMAKNTAANIHITEEIVQDTPPETFATHRLLFWAETENPKLVLIHRQSHQEDLFRNIRISRIITPGMQEDQRMPKLFEGTAQRKRIGKILESQLLPLVDADGETNWQKTYEVTSRLIDRLHRGGYDGVTMTVQDDGLEIMFPRFTSEGLTLIPAIEFDMPLPSLELLLRQHPGITEEILIGNPEDRRYNLLHPAVQQAMAETVLELVDRFGHHPSFGGVAIVLSPETYAQLPFALHPPDDHTFTQFRQDTERELGIAFPDEQQLRQTLPTQQFLVQKHAVRLQFLQSNPKVWETWVRWRAAKVSEFYAELARQISSRRGDAPLYLLGGTMFDQSEIQQFCVPTLPRNFTSLQTIQLLGFDLSRLSRTETLHFLKPVIISETSNHSYDGLDSADTASLFSKSGMLTGVQFVHTDNDYFITTPAHIQSRKRFVRQLAQADVLMFMDAGVTLPFGQESAQFNLLDTYRRLPSVAFRTFQPADNQASLQPLTIRYHNLPDGMMVYIVNDAPFAVDADFFFATNLESRITELTGYRMIRSLGRHHLAGIPGPPRHTWRASLQPYDLLAVQINDANASIESVQVHRPPSIESALRQKVEELVQRVHTARGGGVQFDGLVNGDFEMPVFNMVFRNSYPARRGQPNDFELLPDTEVIIPGWQRFFGAGMTAQIDNTVASTGQNSVRLTNNSAEPGTFLSDPFGIPQTGRLDVSMFVGIPADAGSLPMSVVLSAKHRGQPFYRHAPVGETLMPLLANVEPRDGVRWHRLVVPFRLPSDSFEEVQIGVQYSGSGTVWIDDVTLQHVSFSPNEIVELQKKLVVADQRSSAGRVSDLISLLEGHWSQFLFEHVPAPDPLPVISVASQPVASEVVAPQSPTLYQRVRGWFVR